MNCPHCNQEIPDTAKFCGHCGNKIEAAQSTTVPATPPAQQQTLETQPPPAAPQAEIAPQPVVTEVATSRGTPTCVWGLIGVVIVAIVIGGFLLLSGSPSNTNEAPQAAQQELEVPEVIGQSSNDQAAEEAADAPEPQPLPQNTDQLAGNWTGTIKGITGDFSTDLTIRIESGCSTGNVCGKYLVPEFACEGDLFLTRIDDDVYFFEEQVTVGDCESGNIQHLSITSSGNLLYELSSTGNRDDIVSRGVLQ